MLMKLLNNTAVNDDNPYVLFQIILNNLKEK